MTDLSHARVSLAQLRKLDQDGIARAIGMGQALVDAQAQRLFFSIYPDEDSLWLGPTVLDGLIEQGQTLHSRHKYQQHLEFFRRGAEFSERAFMAANRCGKTFSGGGYEMACHLTGLYPDWWEGRRFHRPISAWAAGDTNETTRDIIQLNLLGKTRTNTFTGRREMDGRGIIPGHTIGKPRWKSGVIDFIDSVPVRHVSGGWSVLGFKSYVQGRLSFQGTARHVIWLDEACPEEIYDECLIRTTTTHGIIMLTFTPIEGMTPLAMSFLPKEDVS